MFDFIWYKVYRERICVSLYGSRNLLDKIVDSISPYYYSEYVDEPVNTSWKIVLDINSIDHAKFSDWQEIIVNYPNEPTRKYLLSSSEKTIIIIEPNEIVWKIQQVIRLVRDIVRNEFIQEDMNYYHSAVLTYKDKGICVMGSKKSGKTTTILSLLTTQKANFISNDDLSLRLIDGKLVGYGWPRAVSVRNDSFEALRALNVNINRNTLELTHPSNTIKLRDNYTFFILKKLCKRLEETYFQLLRLI